MLDANLGLSSLLRYLIQTKKLEVHYCKHQECNQVATCVGILQDPTGLEQYGLLTSGNMNYRCQNHQADLVHCSQLTIDPLLTYLIPWIEGNYNER